MLSSNCTSNQTGLEYTSSWTNQHTDLSCIENVTYDVTNGSEFKIVENKYLSAVSPLADIFVGLYLIFVQLMSTIFNGLVLGLSIWKRKNLKASDMFVVWLAASDIGHPLTAYPMVITSSFMHEWIYGDIGCQWNGFTSFFFGVSSMMTLTTMSFGRLMYITHADKVRHRSKCMVITLLGVVLFSSLFWAVAPLVGWGKYGPEPFKTSCTLVWDYPDRSFVTSSFVFVMGVPVMVMFYSYGRILCLAMETRRRRLHWAQRTKENRLWEKKELRLLKITIVMCCTYVLFWSPYTLVAMIKSYASHVHIPPTLSLFPCLAAKTSHVANPIIYCMLNKNFSRYIPMIFVKKAKQTDEVEDDPTTQTLPLKGGAIVEYEASSPMTTTPE